MKKRAFALAAHPDDIEFVMAGTLILLAQAGYEIHYMNVGNGSCGTASLPKDEIIEIRRTEAQQAAASVGAIYHESLTDDFTIFYEPRLLARLSSVMRKVAPEILLLQSPQDYMEDHQNTVRLAVTAAFTRGMRNFSTDPQHAPVDHPVAIYHAQPHGNRDTLGNFIRPHFCVDIGSVIEQKTHMLSCHMSQKSWLDQSQGMDAYLHTMQGLGKEVAGFASGLTYAEGWRKRLHLGYANADFSPLERSLAPYLVDLPTQSTSSNAYTS